MKKINFDKSKQKYHKENKNRIKIKYQYKKENINKRNLLCLK